MFVVWQGIDVLQQDSEAEHARVRHYHLSNKENGGGYMWPSRSQCKKVRTTKLTAKGLSHYSCKNKCYNNVEYRNFDLNIKI